MPLAVAFQPAASSAARALAGSTRPGSDGFHAAVLSPCFPGFFTDSTSSQNSLCFAPLSSITTPCFPAHTTLPERPPQEAPTQAHLRHPVLDPHDVALDRRPARPYRERHLVPDLGAVVAEVGRPAHLLRDQGQGRVS